MERLRKRSDFLRVARGHKQVRRALVLQAWHHQPEGPGEPKNDEPENGPVSGITRLGFTVTRKVGNAVVRNRVRRRLREAVRLLEKSSAAAGQDSQFRPDTDYVLVGRLAALTMPFAEIQHDLARALDKISSQIRIRQSKLGKKAEKPDEDHSPIDQIPLKEQGIKPNDVA
uniref:ribonuclease P protein component n=1 Tax=Pararhizobium sp. IMCC3301 TaxID=3067904 RepID=UPI002741A268|nr:ribonuclease P protein component [Pararhizobium sp. IMCC3301]